VVEEFSRIGRSTRHVLDIIDQLDQKGVEFVSLSEKIETKTPMGRLMLQFLAALCEFEAAITRERVLEGNQKSKSGFCHQRINPIFIFVKKRSYTFAF
jgi:DNA invertase Pin-like site-specific DNA recombinase